MRYMLLIYSVETDRASRTPEESDAIMSRHRAVIEESSRLGVFRGAEPLRPTSTATTVRMNGGQAMITDGPFAETKEQLAGYYILDCEDLDEAIQWAAKIPTACKGQEGAVEIRPIHELPPPNDSAFQASKPSASA